MAQGNSASADAKGESLTEGVDLNAEGSEGINKAIKDTANSELFGGSDNTDNDLISDGAVDLEEEYQKIQSQLKKTSEENIKLKEANATLEKRNKDSDREAQRLHNQQKDIEEILPMIEIISEDEKLKGMVTDYIKGEKTQTTNSSPAEDVLVDVDEMFNNPSSQSADVFRREVRKEAQRLFNEEREKELKENEIRTRQENIQKQRQELIDSGVTEDEISEIIKYAKAKKLDLKTLKLLRDLESGKLPADIANSLAKNKSEHLQNLQNANTSLASANNAEEETSDEDETLKAILKEMNKGMF